MYKLFYKIGRSDREEISEEEYIDRIASFEKECWRRSLNEDAIFVETRKYVKKIKLSKEKHPFLIKFRDDLDKVYKNSRYNSSEYNKLFRSFHEYRSNIKKNNVV